ncbi:MAG: hypothetical protein ACFFCX_16685, partial [Candidatus Sifarchaeia archaeon]
MRLKKLVSIALVLFPIILVFMISSNQVQTSSTMYSNINDPEKSQGSIPIEYPINDQPNVEYALSQDSKEGIINPVQIKQSGLQETEAVRARTDTGTNAIQNITIDEGNYWYANYTTVEVSNIKRLYGVNGTFENGVSPWTTYTIDGGSNVQIPSYDSDGAYIVCRNVGEYKKEGQQHAWTHSAGSEVGWDQIIYNPEGKLNFNLKLDYRFVTGPIDPEGDNSLPGVIGVFYQIQRGAYLDGWYYPMDLYVNSRDAWYTIQHEFVIPSPWPDFQLDVGLYLAGTIKLYNATDYDDDPLALPDGQEHAQNLTIYIDNVEFTGAAAPSFENVNLTFHAGTFSEAITGTGIGTATISNPSYWTANPLQVGITSNTSVVFTYTVTTLFHRYVNSSWTTHPTKQGAVYSLTSGQSADIAFFTYVPSAIEYQNLQIDIEYPWDWENVTIWDPLRNNITDLCAVTPGLIRVPNSEVNRVGWWEVDLQAPNYAKNISIELQDGENWLPSTNFWTSNITRAQVEIGTAGVTPEQGNPVNITWFLPNGTEWSSDSITTMIDGVVNSSSWVLGGLNTTAGEWEIEVIWSNGSEIGYEVVLFDMYHKASAAISYPIIETDHGLIISNLVTLLDADNGKYLLDDSVSILANWSSSSITFSPNFAKKWWEADFDTDLIGGGQYTVIVNISRPYFDDISCQFIVISTYTASMTLPSIGPYPVELGLNEIYLIDIHYELSNGTGIEGATLSMSYSGPSSGIIEGTQTDLGLGNYTLEISGVLSGEYQITVIVSKSYHEEISKSFALIIGETGTSFTSLNGSAALIGFGLDFRLVLNYSNSTGDGLLGATVEIIDVTPASGLTIGSMNDEGSGIYSVTFTPAVSQTYTIVIRANLTNHETQFITFTLLVNDVQTSLSSSASGATISVDQAYVLQLTYEDQASNPILGATIGLATVPSGLGYSWVEVGGGVYNVTLTPSVTEPKSFQLSFRASKVNYQTSSIAFSLFVQLIPTDLEILVGSSTASISVIDEYSLVVSYLRTDTNLNITTADIVISTSPASGITSSISEVAGAYELTFQALTVGIWQITVIANRTYYVTSIIQLELEVTPIDTVLSCLNGSADLLAFGDTYRLALRYQNSTGEGILGATVIIQETSPSTGLSIGLTVDEGNGYYSITLSPTASGAYSVTLRANYTNHVTQYISFSLVVSPIETVLIPHTSGATISLDKNYTVQLEFRDELNNPIANATISIIELPAEISYTVREIGGGIYNVTLIPSVVKVASFQISFRASKATYQSSVTAFVLQVQEIPTEIIVFSGEMSETILFTERYVIEMAYMRTDINERVFFADITPVASPSDGLEWIIEEVGGIYSITFTTTKIGSWQIAVTANRTSYVKHNILLELEVEQIDTSLNDITLVESLVFGRTYNFTFNYQMFNNSRVHDADVTPVGTGSTWISVTEGASGEYRLSLTPQGTGGFEIAIEFSRTGFVSQVTLLSFN